MLLYTHSCNFPWYLTTIVFHARRGALFICSEGCRVCYFRPHPPTPHLIWCPPFPGIIQKTNLTLYSWSSLSDKHSSVFSPNVNRHYPPTWHWSALIIPRLPPLLSLSLVCLLESVWLLIDGNRVIKGWSHHCYRVMPRLVNAPLFVRFMKS